MTAPRPVLVVGALIALAALLFALRLRAPAPAPEPEAAPPSPSALRPGLHDEALRALKEGDVEGARAMAREMIESQPENPAGHILASEIAFVTGEFQAGTEAAEKAVSLAGEQGGTLPSLLRFQLLGDSAAALETARKLYRREPGRVETRLGLAEATLYEASDRGAGLEESKQAAASAIELLEPMAARVRTTTMAGDVLSVLGGAHYMAGDLEQAAGLFEEALDSGIPMVDRATDTANALAWTRFRLGDREGMVKAIDRALDAMRGPESQQVFGLLPKWELYSLYAATWSGKPGEAEGMDRLEPYYQQLRERGFVEHPSYAASRERLRGLQQAAARGDFAEAWYLLSRDAADLEGPSQNPYVSEGGAWMPRCFFLVTFEQPAEELFYRVYLGEVAAGAGYPKEAGKWFRRALELAPDNPILTSRLEKLDGSGKAFPGLGPEETLRMLDRFWKEGRAAAFHGGCGQQLSEKVDYTEIVRLRNAGAGVDECLERALEANRLGLMRFVQRDRFGYGVWTAPVEGEGLQVHPGLMALPGEVEMVLEGDAWRLLHLNVEGLRN